MFDEQWQFAVEVERKYNQYRKKVMVRYDLSAAEVDVLLFLANNSQFDLAVDIVRVRKMQKSHVSLAVNKLCEKGYIANEDATVSVLIPKEQVQAEESRYFVDRTFDGSLPGFITAFLGGKKISKKEAKLLKKMIDEHKEG